jgi:hypothetical protein
MRVPTHTAQAGREGGSGTFLNRLEYSASQPPHLLTQARWSVHRSVQLVRWFRRMRLLRFKGPPAHVSTPFRAGHRPGIRPVIRQPPGGVPGRAVRRFPAAFRPPAFASWAPCPARRDSAPFTVGLPPPVRIPVHLRRTLAGFTRFTRVRPGPGRALSISRGRRCSSAIEISVAAACRLTAAGPYHLGTSTQPEVLVSRDISKSFRIVAPPALPLTCDRHGWDSGPWAFP